MKCTEEQYDLHIKRIVNYLKKELQGDDDIQNSFNVLVGCLAYFSGRGIHKMDVFQMLKKIITHKEDEYNRIRAEQDFDR